MAKQLCAAASSTSNHPTTTGDVGRGVYKWLWQEEGGEEPPPVSASSGIDPTRTSPGCQSPLPLPQQQARHSPQVSPGGGMTIAEYFCVHSDDEATTPSITPQRRPRQQRQQLQQQPAAAAAFQNCRGSLSRGSFETAATASENQQQHQRSSSRKGFLQTLRTAIGSSVRLRPSDAPGTDAHASSRNWRLPSDSSCQRSSESSAAAAAPRGFSNAMWRLLQTPPAGRSTPKPRGRLQGK